MAASRSVTMDCDLLSHVAAYTNSPLPALPAVHVCTAAEADRQGTIRSYGTLSEQSSHLFQTQDQMDKLRQQSTPLEKRVEMLKLLLHGVDPTAPLAVQDTVLKECLERADSTYSSTVLCKSALRKRIAAYAEGVAQFKKLQAAACQLREVLNAKRAALEQEESVALALARSSQGCSNDGLPVTRSLIAAQEIELANSRAQNNLLKQRLAREAELVSSIKAVCQDYDEITVKQKLQLQLKAALAERSAVDETHLRDEPAATSFARPDHEANLCYLQSAACTPCGKLTCTFGTNECLCSLVVDLGDTWSNDSEVAVIKGIELSPACFFSIDEIRRDFIGTSSFQLLVTVVIRQWSWVAPLATEISHLRERFALDWQPERDPHTIQVILGMKGNMMATLQVPCNYHSGGLVAVQSIIGCEQPGLEVPAENRARVSTTVQFLTDNLALLR